MQLLPRGMQDLPRMTPPASGLPRDRPKDHCETTDKKALCGAEQGKVG
jgi:hypothetical protein